MDLNNVFKGGFGVLGANKKLQFLIYIFLDLCQHCANNAGWGVRRKANSFISEGDESRLVSPFAVQSLFFSRGRRQSCGCLLHAAEPGGISTPLGEWGGNQDKSRDGDCKYSCLRWINGYLWVPGVPAEMPPLSPPAGRAGWSACVRSFTVEISKRSWISEGDQKLDVVLMR